MEQLGSYAADLRNLEGTNIVEIAQWVLGKLRAEQKRAFEETEKEIAERTHHLDKNRANIRAYLNIFTSQS